MSTRFLATLGAAMYIGASLLAHVNRVTARMSVTTTSIAVTPCEAIQVAIDSLGHLGPGDFVVMQSTTIAYNDGSRTRAFLDQLHQTDGLSTKTWQNFLDRNRAAESPCPHFPRDASVRQEPASKNYDARWWQAFRTKYPRAKAWVSLSATGMRDDDQQAFLVITWSVNERGGARYYVLLDRTANDTWRIASIRREQMSD